MYARILIVVGAVPTSKAAIYEGLALAKVHAAAVVFFTVLPRYVMPVTEMPIASLPSPDEFQRQARADAGRLLEAARRLARKAGVPSQGAMGSGAEDAECIVEAAENLGCDLIVVASAGRNAVMRLLTGSVIPGLITRSPLPVLVCRQASPAGKPERAGTGAEHPGQDKAAAP